MRRIPAVAALLAVASALGPVSPAFAEFSDIRASSHSEAILSLQADGVVEGYANGTFQPNATINRAEFLKIVLEAAYADADIAAGQSSASFPDVPQGAWFAKYVNFGVSNDIIDGYPDGTFKPDEDVNFVEAGKIMTLAFKLSPQDTSGEWYEPYARALEASKAIPAEVSSLETKLTRGQMAEMLWRVIEKRTDRPSKGLLNLKYPTLSLNLASDDVQTAKTCADLSAFAQYAAQSPSGGYGYGRGVMLMDEAADMAGAPAPTMANAVGREAEKSASDDGYSQTNVQVQGVDEADIIKTDGKYVYMLRGGQVKIVDARTPADLSVLATIDFSDKTGFGPTEMYVDDGRLVVIGSRWMNYPMPYGRGPADAKMMIWPPWGGTSRTDIRIYDVSNAAKPSLKRELSFEGSGVSTRRIGDKLYMVLQQPMRWNGPVIMEKDVMPLYSDSAKGSADMAVAGCNRVAVLPHVPRPQYMTVAVIPTRSDAAVSTDVVLGDAQNVYMSLEGLYVATTEWNYVWDSANPQSSEKTNVYRFAVTSDGVDFADKGTVPGHILNQFSMDEHEDHFRIATTVSPTWSGRGTETSTSTNNLYVLNAGMEIVGSVEDIAPGESIYSVRYMGDRAYMVTFKQVDPLFVIDVGNPRSPKILGKLKIPGYSNYLHPYDENHVLGFGKEVDESIDKDKVHSDDAVYYTAIQGMKISMFDVSDVANPKEKFKEVIGDRGTESPLLTDHKALLFDKERGLLAFPILVAERKAGEAKSEAGSPTFQGAYVYDVSLSKGFTKRGSITHYAKDTFAKAGDYWYGGQRDISRILRIGSSLFTVSHDAVQANAESTLAVQDTVELGTSDAKF